MISSCTFSSLNSEERKSLSGAYKKRGVRETGERVEEARRERMRASENASATLLRHFQLREITSRY